MQFLWFLFLRLYFHVAAYIRAFHVRVCYLKHLAVTTDELSPFCFLRLEAWAFAVALNLLIWITESIRGVSMQISLQLSVYSLAKPERSFYAVNFYISLLFTFTNNYPLMKHCQCSWCIFFQVKCHQSCVEWILGMSGIWNKCFPVVMFKDTHSATKTVFFSSKNGLWATKI